MSQTHKLIVQITQVCKEIHDIKTSNIITKNLHQPKPPDSCKRPPSNKHEKGGTDCTHSSNSRSNDQNGDQRNNPYNPGCCASGSPSPPEPLPPELPVSQSSHVSEESSSIEASTSSEWLPSWIEDNTFTL